MGSSIQTPQTAFSYDAVTLLGFGKPTTEALPEATKAGEIVLRYGGWSLQDLRGSKIVCQKNILWGQDWYDRYPWSAEKLPSGLYALRLPVPDSNRKTFDEQKALLLPGEEPAPVVLGASALLAHLLSTGEHLLQGHWLRCKERADASDCVELRWDVGRLSVLSYWDGNPDGLVWLASARRLPEPCPSSP